jgi:undecaprenyl diphosphate synthase
MPAPSLPPPPDLPALEQRPRHVAIIMDGNGRWAAARGLTRMEGHRRGADAVRTVTRACRRWGIEALTLYAFSSQNWMRPRDEVEALMDLLRDYLHQERAEIMDNGIRLVGIGDTVQLPARVTGPLEALCADSAGNRDMTLCLALSYGGREEILRAVRRLAADAAAGRRRAEDISPSDVDAALWTAAVGLRDPDLVIRTSGELRLSNFLLWQSAYAELWFTEKAWPDFGEADLVAAFKHYAGRQRRFGLTGAQVGDPGDSDL